MKKNNEGTMTAIVIGGAFLLVILYYFTMQMDNIILYTACAVISAWLLLFNVYFLLKNSKIVNKMRKKIYRKDVTQVNYDPLEVYLINSIWYNKTTKITMNQIKSDILYYVGIGYLGFDGSNFTITNRVDLNNMSVGFDYIVKLIFLDGKEFQQASNLQLEKLLRKQRNQEVLSLEDAVMNIDKNIADHSKVINIVDVLKDRYFINVENAFSYSTSVLAIIDIILSAILALSSMGSADIFNFYVPMSFAVLLVFSVTSKNRNRVGLKAECEDTISEVLNFIKYIESNNNIVNESIYYLHMFNLTSGEQKDYINNMLTIE